MDIQHELALIIATYLEREKAKKEDVSENELVILTYGIEVFLNEFIKIIIAVILGILLGEILLVLYSIVFLLLIRRYSGGIHFESNLICLLYSLVAIVVMPVFGKRFDLGIGIAAVLCVVELVAFMFFIEKRHDESKRQLLIRKCKLLFVYVVGLFFAYILGGIPYLRAMSYMIFMITLTLKKVFRNVHV